MTQHAALDIASAFLDAYTGEDPDTARRYLADDFTFDGPLVRYRSAEEFLTGSKAFTNGLQPGWAKVAGFGDDHEALLLYDLSLRSGATMRVADHYTVRDGRIQAETILWDTHGFR